MKTLFVLVFLVWLSPILRAQEWLPEVTPPITTASSPNKAQALENFEAYFIEDVFLKEFFESSPSLLTEEEKEESLVSFGGDFEKELMSKAFASQLAKQDILGFKKSFRKPLHP